MSLPLILSILIGAGIGAALGRAGQCSTGACPLTANWKRGAMYGGVIGLIFGLTLARNGSGSGSLETVNVHPVSEAEFHSQVIQSDRPVVVDFYAPWCGPCKVLSPRLDKLAETRTNQIKFVKVNVDDASTLARQFNVQAIPTLVFFKGGQVVDTMVGLPTEAALRERLDSLASPKPANVTSR